MLNECNVAVVAIACRLPRVRTPAEYWERLRTAKTTIVPWQRERKQAGSLLKDVRGFDAQFFGLESEAEGMDPQQRIFLESGHEALERAGLAGAGRRGRRIGVYVGVGQSDYQETLLARLRSEGALPNGALVGNLRNLIAARLSRFLNLDGPALALDTACSSSLVALHLARQALLTGECDAAVVGGVSIHLGPTSFDLLRRAGVLSPTGRCRPFCREADGTVLGEGAGALVLERLESAHRRGADVLAVVRGSAVNNDGRTTNPMAPKLSAQVAVMRDAWRSAGLAPESAGYIESHGTGTRLGDAVEARSLSAVFGRTGDQPTVLVGSVKGNVGHLLNASGVPSLLKTVLALHHGTIPPTLHAAEADTRHFDGRGIELAARPSAFPEGTVPRAGVSGFGFGGTNAHVVLEAAPAKPRPRRRPRGSAPLWLLSAPSAQALRRVTQQLVDWLRAHPDVEPSDAARSVSLARDPRSHRLAVVGASLVAERLEAWLGGESPDGLHHGIVKRSGGRCEPLGGSPDVQARLFVEGKWEPVMEEAESERLVAVPSYPFDRRPYWGGLEASPAVAQSPHPSTGEPVGPTLASWMHRLVWHGVPEAAPRMTEAWFVGPRSHPLVEVVARVGRAAGTICELLDAGDATRASGRTLVFLGALRAPSEAGTGLQSLLALARTLADGEPSELPSRLVVVTAGATDGGVPEQALVVGAAHSLPDQIPGLACTTLDLEPGEPPDSMARAILEAAECATGTVEVLRWRGGRLCRRGIDAAPAAARPAAPLRDDGVYLVTGGASGLGYALAESLAAPGRTLILAGRRALRDEPARARAVRALGDAGARVEYLQADVGDPDSVSELIASAARARGAIHGVIHAAGVASPRRLQSIDPRSLAAGLRAKVHGTSLLWSEIVDRGLRPDFFALMSSVAACVPGAARALVDYAAANAYLDAFAEARHREGMPVFSIAWSAWSETGMLAGSPGVQSLKEWGLAPIPTEHGVRAFELALSLALPHVLVAPSLPVLDSTPRTRNAAPLPPSPGLQLVDEIRALVAGAADLSVGEVAPDASLLTLGLDSLHLLDLVATLESRLGVEIAPGSVYEHPTAAALAAHIERHRGVDVPSRPAEAASPSRDGPRLSRTEKAFWVNQRLHPGVTAFSYLRLSLEDELDLDRLREAAETAAQRHPLLRATVDSTDLRHPRWKLCERAAVRLRDHGRVEDLDLLAERIVNEPFELESAPLWRVDVARTEELSQLVLCAHHVIADAWSIQVLALDLWRAYVGAAFPGPVATRVSAAPHTVHRADLDWWRAQLADAPRLTLPWKRGPDDAPRGRHQAVMRQLGQTDTDAFSRRAAMLGVTTFQLSVAVFLRCLGRWARQDEVVVNVARSRRELGTKAAAEAIGCFADTLPLRLPLREEPLACTARRVQHAMAQIERHGTPTSLEIASLLPFRGGAPRTAAQVSYSFARFPLGGRDAAPNVRASEARTSSAATRLAVLAWEVNGALSFSFNAPHSLLSSSHLLAWADELAEAHRQAAEDVDESVPEQLRSALAAAADRIVLRQGAVALTGAALLQKSDAVAAALQERGIGPGDAVALLSDQDHEGVVGLLGILRSGATWVPLDPADPPARLGEQMERARVHVCLQSSSAGQGEKMKAVAAARLPELEVLTIPDVSVASAAPRRVAVRDEDIAYVIFTSGSTGRPKGVPIRHGSLRWYLGWALQEFAYGHDDVLLGTASLAFDASVRQVLAPLLAGSVLVPCPRELARDPAELLAVMAEEGVTVLSTVPSLLAQLLRNEIEPLGALRWLKVGGEAVPPGLVRALYDRLATPPAVVNLYGPTETTINAALHIARERPADQAERIPIGRPIGGAVLSVVDVQGVECEPGHPGELWIGGPGLSPGYLDEPELTERAFCWDREGRRFYRSGDLVVRRQDGRLEFLGRLDDQVKIRGHRVELGEVEAVLAGHPQVAVAVVRAVGGEGHRHLEAWVQPLGEPPTEASLRAALEERLPRAMHPRLLHVVDDLPVTQTGKVDRGRLEQARGPHAKAKASQVRLDDDLEAQVVRAFEQVLRRTRVGREDDFFELGGDSIGVLEVFARLEEQGEDRLPRPVALYRARSPRGLAGAIARHREKEGGDEARQQRLQQPVSSWFPLSPAQRGFLATRALAPGSSSLWRARLRLCGPLDGEAFRQAARVVFARHPMLRAILRTRHPAAQTILDPSDPPLTVVMDPSGEESDELWTSAASLELDVTSVPPVRLWLCVRSENEGELIVAGDHLIGDGMSVWIVAKELLALHDAALRGQELALSPLRGSFRQLVEARSGDEESARKHWRVVFERPYEPPRGWHAGSDAGARYSASVSAGRAERWKRASERGGHTLYELLLTAWAQALSERTGADDLVVGTAMAGRDVRIPDAHRIVGPLATAVPVRAPVSSSPAETLREVAAAFHGARDHQLAPGEIARAAGVSLDVASGSQFFLSFLDFSSMGDSGEASALRVDWERSETRFGVSGAVEIQMFVRRLAGSLHFELRAAAGVLGEAELRSLAERVLAVLDVLCRLPASNVRFGAFDPRQLDAALVGYLPDASELAAASGQPPEKVGGLVQAVFRSGEPMWIEALETRLGRTGFLCLPLLADEVARCSREALVERVGTALGVVADAGIRHVSLAGMLPGFTDYGARLEERGRSLGIELTTGHAATVVAVARAASAAAEAAGLALDGARLAVVGVGSIGGAVLELLVSMASFGTIVLCDVPAAANRLEALQARLRQLGHDGRIEIALADGPAATAVYQADLIVAAASTPRILDADRLMPGTVVVDDSFPAVVDRHRAWQRMKSRGDVLVVGAGLLDLGTVGSTVWDGGPLRAYRRQIQRTLDRPGVPGCQVESLLRAHDPALPATLGLVGADAARRYQDAAGELDIRAAPLHLGTTVLPEALLRRVRGLRARP